MNRRKFIISASGAAATSSVLAMPFDLEQETRLWIESMFSGDAKIDGNFSPTGTPARAFSFGWILGPDDEQKFEDIKKELITSTLGSPSIYDYSPDSTVYWREYPIVSDDTVMFGGRRAPAEKIYFRMSIE